MSVVFTKGGSDVTIRNPERANVYGVKLHQAVGRTAGGVVVSYDKGVTVQRMELQFKELTDTNKSELQAFFEDDVVGTQETFTFTDRESVNWTARFLQDELDWSELDNDRWSIEVHLEVEVGA